MVKAFLIGGAPRCGKTTLAERVARHTRAVWLSADFLEGVIARYLPAEIKAGLFPKNAMRRRTGHSNDRMYREHETSDIVGAYLKQAAAVQPAIEELVARHLLHDRNLVIEGYQLDPDLMSRLRARHGHDRVCCLLLGRNSLEGTVRDCRQGTDNSDWFIRDTADPQQTDWRIALMIRSLSYQLEAEARLLGLPFHLMDGGFRTRLDKAIDLLFCDSGWSAPSGTF